jgi:hypothetical protein
MKSQQSEETTAAKNVGDNGKRSASGKQNGLVLTADHREQSFEYWPRPSELELAHLAARLARTEKIDPKQLVNQAWDLYWESCRKIQADHREVGKVLEALEARDGEMQLAERGDLPKPERFPVTFQEMELLLLPKLTGRTGERAAVFREYAFAQIIGGSFTFRGGLRVLTYWDFQPDALEELRERLRGLVSERFGTWRKGVYDAKAYATFAGPFLNWYCRWTERRRSEARAANARKGWEKRRKAKRTKTGARPQMSALRRILENS